MFVDFLHFSVRICHVTEPEKTLRDTPHILTSSSFFIHHKVSVKTSVRNVYTWGPWWHMLQAPPEILGICLCLFFCINPFLCLFPAVMLRLLSTSSYGWFEMQSRLCHPELLSGWTWKVPPSSWRRRPIKRSTSSLPSAKRDRLPAAGGSCQIGPCWDFAGEHEDVGPGVRFKQLTSCM